MPRIVADRNIACVVEAFAQLGDVLALPAESIDAAAVRDADLVLVRSATRVDDRLLGGSRARFVGTATIGTDHLDTAWLEARGIAWASAPGSNAASVAQWLAAAVLALSARAGRPVASLTAGVVGYGNVGTRASAVLSALGARVLVCDPPRRRREDLDVEAVTLDALCAGADLVTLHVPLTDEGPDATRGLFDAARVASLRAGAWLVNASRGAVLDGAAAARARRAGLLGGLALDVFDPEPAVPPDVVAACDVATPHVAGHSLDGKVAGTEMILRAACAFLGVAPRWSAGAALPTVDPQTLRLDPALADEDAARALVAAHYDLGADDGALRGLAGEPDPAGRARLFRRYREQYPERREPRGVRVRVAQPRAVALAAALGALVEAG